MAIKTKSMLGCLKPRTEESIRSRQLDKELQAVSKQFENAIKILLLGTGESGKTTIIKQMKVLHVNGFTEDEKLDKIREIRQNAHESIYELTINLSKLNISLDSSKNKQKCDFIMKMGKTLPEQISNEYIDAVLTLWNDSGIRECFHRSNEFQLIDSAKYFLDKLEVISNQNYMPTVDDMLRSRKITSGIHQINFSVKIPKSMGGGVQEFRMFDVGGQRDQRNKWLQVFEGIQAVLFIISCGDYDQTLREDPSQNRLTEALELFGCVWNNRFLSSAGIIVFLNKQDIMEAKIKSGKTIGQYFDDYDQYRLSAKDGNVFDEYNRTRCFIRQKLINITLEPPPRRPSQLSSHSPRECYYHFTVATDTNNIRKVFNDVHNMILTENLSSVGLL